MSGHSHWATTKRAKGLVDAQRGKVFTKIVREITSAVKLGGPDVNNNPRLRLAVQNAKGVNMPKDNIERAIKKGGDNDGVNYTDITYEGTASYGSAFIIECMTDNPNRTVGELRALFTRHNGILGKSSISYLFDRRSTFIIGDIDDASVDELQLSLIDYGVDEFEKDEGCYYFTAPVESFGKIQNELDKGDINVQRAELRYIPQSTIEISEEEATKLGNFVDTIENLDDVQHVYHNIDIP